MSAQLVAKTPQFVRITVVCFAGAWLANAEPAAAQVTITQVNGATIVLSAGREAGIRKWMTGKVIHSEVIGGQTQDLPIASFQMTSVTPGSVTAELSEIGQGSVIVPGLEVRFDQPLQAVLVLEVVPAEASVLVAGSNYGTRRQIDVNPGGYLVRAELPGYEPASESVHVRAGEIRSVSLELARNHEDWLNLYTTANRAFEMKEWDTATQYYSRVLEQVPDHQIARERLDKSNDEIRTREAREWARAELPMYRENARTFMAVGDYTGAEEWIKKIEALDPNDSLLQKPELKCVLTVRSEPESASVRLDGDLLGVTPLESVPVAWGKHELRVERQNHVTESESVVLPLGRSFERMLVLRSTTPEFEIPAVPFVPSVPMPQPRRDAVVVFLGRGVSMPEKKFRTGLWEDDVDNLVSVAVCVDNPATNSWWRRMEISYSAVERPLVERWLDLSVQVIRRSEGPIVPYIAMGPLIGGRLQPAMTRHSRFTAAVAGSIGLMARSAFAEVHGRWEPTTLPRRFVDVSGGRARMGVRLGLSIPMTKRALEHSAEGEGTAAGSPVGG